MSKVTDLGNVHRVRTRACVLLQVGSQRTVQIQRVNQRYGSSRIPVAERTLRCTSIMHIFVCASMLPAGSCVFHVCVCVHTCFCT